MTTTSDTVAEKPPPGAKPKTPWQKTPYPNLIRYVPSGTYFGRVKVDSKLIRRSLDAGVLEVAKLRLSDFVKDHHRFTTNKAAIKGEVIVGLYRIHHDLRHLFATRCIENGVDIPTVSRWLGHQDGGALCMKTYGHLRDEHSSNEARKVAF
jgi:integrase